MKYFLQLVALPCIFILFSQTKTKAQDTIHVQCFTYGSSQDSSFIFPSDTIRFRKILMNYKLACNPAQTPACGEWDYLTYTYLFQPTGLFDSVMHVSPSFIVNGISPDSFQLMHSPSYSYISYFENYIVHDSTISLDSTIISSNTINMSHPLNAVMPVCRSQYLEKANELSAAGLHSGNITGLRLNIQSSGSMMKHLTIRIKASLLDSINTINYEQSGFSIVYDRNTTFNSTGWQTIEFTNYFYWDGISNLVIDYSFENDVSGTPSLVSGGVSAFPSGITTQSEDRSLFFEGNDYINVQSQAFSNLDSAITICFWAYGNPLYQPQNQSIFEGVDSLGQRVLNCHLPWGNGMIYWDAGNSSTSSYDRINKQGVNSDYEGSWAYWAFTKNTSGAGWMRIYRNGVLYYQAAGKHKLMSGIKKLKIGSNASGKSNYDGWIDDFAVFNTELSAATINQWMYKKIDNTHPDYANLLLYYDFDHASLTSVADSAPGHNDGTLFGIPQSALYTSTDVFKNLVNTNERPDYIFEQGVYNSHVDSTLLVDSTQNAAYSIVYFNDSLHPTTATDTGLVWGTYYNNYIYNSNGQATDSTLVPPDSTVFLTNYQWWDPPYAINNRYELGRFITPYGNNLSLGSGFTWIYDVSDYRTLLHDTVHLTAGNWQELLDLSFDMIKGIPPRDPISVENIYKGGDFVYGSSSNPIESHFPPKNVYIDSSAANTRIKYRSTGHGEDNNNCDEFCAKLQYINVDSVQRFSQLVWKDDCDLNPLYPQGGTWLYERANWCPGDDVPTFDYELTPYVTPGDSALIDVNFEPYSTAGGSAAHCVVETQLIKYHAPNFSLDAAVYDIKTPSNLQIYQRHNPICNNPLITIQNTGSTPLTSLTITYGQVGGTQSIYNWLGNLSFMQIQDVQLGNMVWNGTIPKFTVTISNPNGGADQYAGNNSMTSTYSIPPQLDHNLIFQLKTNLRASENSYTLKDDQGNIVFSRSGLTNNTVYNDTLNLPNGCYEFRLTDTGPGGGGDGLYFWANTAAGSGYMKIKRVSNGAVLQNFNPDFGSEIYYQFTVGYSVDVNNLQPVNDIRIYPNPTTGKINFDLNFSDIQNVTIEIYTITGEKIYSSKANSVTYQNSVADLSLQPAGIYLVRIKTNDGIYHSKIVLTK